MGKLRDRLDRFYEAQEGIRKQVEVSERYERAVPGLEYMYSLIEGDNVMKQRRFAERQSIKTAGQLYEKTMDEVYGGRNKLVNELLEDYDRLNLTTEDAAPTMSIEEIQENQYRDVVENFLYTEWLDQLPKGEYSPNSVNTFSHYCTYVSLKAFVNLVTMHQDSLKALLELGIFIPDDLRNRCVKFKDREDYQPDNALWYTSTLLSEVPEAWNTSQQLLIHYSDQARLENVSTPLPDNPFVDTVDSERARIRQGINAYVAREGSVKDISRKYGLTRRQLEDELRNAGLLRRHGGKRK